MANTTVGGAKAAATKLKIYVEEYQQKINSGFKWCSHCRSFKPQILFNKSSRNKCQICSRAADRRRYKPVPIEERKPRGFVPHPPRDGDKQQARNRVNRMVRNGKLPRAQAVPCTDCGHIGRDILHEYDHYLGYAAINHLEVQCVCVPCHNEREQRRKQ